MRTSTQAEPSRPAPYIAITIAVLAVSTASIFIRFAQQEAPSLVIAAYRLGIATVLITPLALLRYRHELRRLTWRDLGWALASGFFLGAHFGTWISSLDYTTVMVSVVVVTTSPLWVALASALLMGERLRRGTVAGLGLALAGGVLIALGGDDSGSFSAESMRLGSFLSLVGAWTVAGYWMIGRRLRARFSVITYTWLVYGTAAVVLWLAVLVTGQPAAGYPGETYVWLVLLAVVPQLMGHSLFNYALAELSAVYVSVATLGEPVGSAILALLLLGEVPTLLHLAGGVLILSGIYLASREEQSQAAQDDQGEVDL